MALADPSFAPHPHRTPDQLEADLTRKTLLTLLSLVMAWGAAIYHFGLPGLYLPALAAVPFILSALVVIAWGGRIRR